MSFIINYIFVDFGILTLLLLIPLFSAFIVALFPRSQSDNYLKNFTCGSMIVIFLVVCLLIYFFNSNYSPMSSLDNYITADSLSNTNVTQYTSPALQFMENYTLFPYFNISLSLGIDGISLSFIFLTAMIMPIGLYSSYSVIKQNVREYLICLLLIEFLLLGSFMVLDLLLFYVFFETVLIPMFIIVVLYGSRERKAYAAYLLVLYTVFGSLFMLIALFDVLSNYGSLNYLILLNNNFPIEYQNKIFLGFFIAFAVKVPMLPFHNWLPEAHVEAPTVGSVILAAVLLKLGVYGMIRFLIPICPLSSLYFSPLVLTLCCAGLFYTSLTAIRQVDMKRVIAYSSIAHMNLVIMGLFSFTVQGLEGAILQSVSHGFVSSGLFLCVGVLYDRYHTRIIEYYGGLTLVMPNFAIIFFFFTIANIAFPLTSSFVGEFLILSGVFDSNPFSAFVGCTGMVLSTVYSLWLYNRLMFGQLKDIYITKFSDINVREFVIFFPLIIGTIVLGVYPDVLLKGIHTPVLFILEQINSRII